MHYVTGSRKWGWNPDPLGYFSHRIQWSRRFPAESRITPSQEVGPAGPAREAVPHGLLAGGVQLEQDASSLCRLRSRCRRGRLRVADHTRYGAAIGPAREVVNTVR